MIVKAYICCAIPSNLICQRSRLAQTYILRTDSFCRDLSGNLANVNLTFPTLTLTMFPCIQIFANTFGTKYERVCAYLKVYACGRMHSY